MHSLGRSSPAAEEGSYPPRVSGRLARGQMAARTRGHVGPACHFPHASASFPNGSLTNEGVACPPRAARPRPAQQRNAIKESGIKKTRSLQTAAMTLRVLLAVGALADRAGDSSSESASASTATSSSARRRHGCFRDALLSQFALLDDGEAEAGAAHLARPTRVDSVKALEDSRAVNGVDARTVVSDLDAGDVTIDHGRELDVRRARACTSPRSPPSSRSPARAPWGRPRPRDPRRS